MQSRWLLVAVLAATLAGCGAKRGLQPPGGEEPPLPVAAKAQPTFEEMTTPPPPAAPDRVNDPLPRSQPRPDHRFDLPPPRSAEHTSELQSLMRISYAVFCLQKKKLTNSSTVFLSP